MRDELRVDPRLAHPPRDQLRVLPAAVEHQHRPLLGRRLGNRERDDFAGHYPIPMRWACCSDLPSVLIAGASITSAFWKSWIDS